jgi:hypothetical protein
MTADEISLVVDVHNTYRQMLANGSLQSSTSMPPAEDMKELVTVI